MAVTVAVMVVVSTMIAPSGVSIAMISTGTLVVEQDVNMMAVGRNTSAIILIMTLFIMIMFLSK